MIRPTYGNYVLRWKDLIPPEEPYQHIQEKYEQKFKWKITIYVYSKYLKIILQITFVIT